MDKLGRDISIFRLVRRSIAALLVFAAAGTFASPAKDSGPDRRHADIPDPYIRAFHDLVYDQKPPRPVPGKDYGMIADDGVFTHPKATPMVTDPPRFEGQLEYWDQNSYANNVEVLSFVPEIISPFHVWQNIVDFDDRRIMYSYGGRDIGVFDITDPTNVKTLWRGGAVYSAEGFGAERNPLPSGDRYGAATLNIRMHRSGNSRAPVRLTSPHGLAASTCLSPLRRMTAMR